MRLEVDPGVLTGAAARLRQAVEVARDVAHRRGVLAELVAACGSPRLEAAAVDFLGEWGFGMAVIVEDAERLAEMLEVGAEAYLRVEDSLSRRLR